MNQSGAQKALVFLLAVYITLLPVAQAQQGKDVTPPVIKHQPLSEALPLGEPLSISSTVTDDVGVGQVLLFYRTKGRSAYQRAPMRRIGTTSIYMVTLRGVREPGLEYYIQATDLTGNILLEGYDFAPLFVAVAEPGAAPAAAETPQAPAAAPAAAQAPPASATTAAAAKTTSEGSGATKWLWIGLGVLAVGAVASGGGGGGGGDNTGDVVIRAPAPQ